MKVNGEHAAIICPPLVHRLRVNILAAVNEAPMSPSEFVDAGLVPAEMVRSYDQVLSLTAYHFKQLMKAGCLEVIEVIPRRGARENIYAGWSQKRVSEDERRALPSADRVEISRLAVQGLIARADLSMQAETFDQRLDRHLTWRSLTLDEKGWEKLQAILLRTQREIDALRGGTEDLADSAGGGQRINATVGLLGFESPPPLRDRGRAD